VSCCVPEATSGTGGDPGTAPVASNLPPRALAGVSVRASKNIHTPSPCTTVLHSRLLSFAEISDAGLTDEFATRFAKTALFSAASPCHAILLPNNHLSDAGLAALCAVMESTGVKHPLRQLSLAYNCITDVGAKALALALSSGSSLEVLNLEGNMVGTAGARDLAAALPAAPISAVHLSFNGSSTADLSCWAGALQSPWLEVLEVAQLKAPSCEV
jgi:Leucine Rich repeat